MTIRPRPLTDPMLSDLAYFQLKLDRGLRIPPSYVSHAAPQEDEVDPMTTVPDEGGICLPLEAKHLHAIFRRTRGRPGVWIDSAYTTDRPVPEPLAGLWDRGFIKTSIRRSGPLDMRDLGWSVCITEEGVIAAKLLGFTIQKAD